MKIRRFGVSVLAALLVAAVPAAALADLYVNGKDGLKPADRNQCTYYGDGFRCSLSPGQETLVTFHDKTDKKSCAWRVLLKSHFGSIGLHWDVEPNYRQENRVLMKCSNYWQNENTVDIKEVK